MPHPDSISLADALAFDAFTDEQKRIAFAGVALHDTIEARLEDARREGFDDGHAAALDETRDVRDARDADLADRIDDQANKLALAIPLLPLGHTADAELRAIRRALTDLVDTLRNG